MLSPNKRGCWMVAPSHSVLRTLQVPPSGLPKHWHPLWQSLESGSVAPSSSSWAKAGSSSAVKLSKGHATHDYIIECRGCLLPTEGQVTESSCCMWHRDIHPEKLQEKYRKKIESAFCLYHDSWTVLVSFQLFLLWKKCWSYTRTKMSDFTHAKYFL